MEKEEKIRAIVDWVQDNYPGTINLPNYKEVSEDLKELEITRKEYEEAESDFNLGECADCGWTDIQDDLDEDGFCWHCTQYK